jgi:NhaC family Na+:H+ antiporter
LNWNSCGAYIAATLGVATWSYSPYAVFSIVSPLLMVAVAYAGFRMLRLPPPSAPAPTEATKSPGIRP